MTKRDFIGRKEQGFREQKLTDNLTGQDGRKYQPNSLHPIFFFFFLDLKSLLAKALETEPDRSRHDRSPTFDEDLLIGRTTDL